MLSKSNISDKSLTSFLEEYESLANDCNFDPLVNFIDKDAIYWFSNGSYEGIDEIRKAFEQTWKNLKDETYTISDVQWLISNDTDAVCIYKFNSDSTVNGKRQIYSGRGTNIFKKIGGKWKITHEHLSKDK